MGYVWLGIACLLLLLLFMFPVRLRIEYGYSKNAAKQRLTVWVNGVCIFKTEFKKKGKSPAPLKTEENNDGGFRGFMEKTRFYDAAFAYLRTDLVRMLSYFQKKLQIPCYTMHMDLGFADAANTGIAAGAAYGLVYGLAALIYNHLNLKKKDLDVYVTPHFHNQRLDFYFNGIFRLRVVHIIKALIMLWGIYNKFKKFKNKTNEGGVLV